MSKNISTIHRFGFVLGFIAVLLSFVAAFAPLIKIPLVGKISYWKAEPVAALIYLSGTLAAMWFLSKDQYRRFWLSATIQVTSFGFIAVSHLWVAEQKGHFSQAVKTISSPVTSFTAELLLNRAAWQVGMFALICSFFILLLVSFFSRSR